MLLNREQLIAAQRSGNLRICPRPSRCGYGSRDGHPDSISLYLGEIFYRADEHKLREWSCNEESRNGKTILEFLKHRGEMIICRPRRNNQEGGKLRLALGEAVLVCMKQRVVVWKSALSASIGSNGWCASKGLELLAATITPEGIIQAAMYNRGNAPVYLRTGQPLLKLFCYEQPNCQGPYRQSALPPAQELNNHCEVEAEHSGKPVRSPDHRCHRHHRGDGGEDSSVRKFSELPFMQPQGVRTPNATDRMPSSSRR